MMLPAHLQNSFSCKTVILDVEVLARTRTRPKWHSGKDDKARTTAHKKTSLGHAGIIVLHRLTPIVDLKVSNVV